MSVPASHTPQLTEPALTQSVVSVELPAQEQAISENNIIAVTALGHFICHMAELVYPAVIFAVIAEFGLKESSAASLGVLGWVLLGAGAVPVGIWADRWGPTRVLRLYFLIMTAASFLVALTPPNAWLLFGTLTLLGLAASIYHPVGLAMLSLGVKARGRAMGINGVAGNIGIALGPTLGILFCFTGWWRMAYVVVAALSLLSFLIFLWLTRHVKLSDDPFRKPRPVKNIQRPSLGHRIGQFTKGLSDTANLRRLLPMLLLYAAMLCGGFNYRYLMTALPNYISGKLSTTQKNELVQGVSSIGILNAPLGQGPLPATTALYPQRFEKLKPIEQPASTSSFKLDYASGFKLLLILLIGGIGQYAGGWLSDRFGAKIVYPAMISVVVPMGILLGLTGGGTMALLPACILAAFMFGQQPVENSVLAEKTSRGRRGLSYATKFTLSFGVGALGAAVAGVVWERISLNAVFFLLSGGAVLMFLFAVTALRLPVESEG